jgi:hypothetical protein
MRTFHSHLCGRSTAATALMRTMKFAHELEDALQSKKLNSVTEALSELARSLGYQLHPPFTEVVRLKAEEREDRFAVQFSAKLNLHYSGTQMQDGLVFMVGFGGQGYADSPSPPVDELFAAGVVDSFVVYGYGERWPGQTIATPRELMDRLEVSSLTLNKIATDDFLHLIAAL